MPETSPSSPEATPLRKKPLQRRARERVERILNCACELITESGSDAMRMSELAKKAGISIGSLYQYFPDKSAVIRTLAERYHEAGQHCIREGLAGVNSVEELCQAFRALVDEYYAIFLAEPVMRDIWSGTQADKDLRQIDLEDSRKNGAELATAMTRVYPDADAEEIASTAFLIMHLGESAMRLAISVHRQEGDAIVATYQRMAEAELRRER